MKQIILIFAFVVAAPSILAGCDKASSDEQAQKEKQRVAKDRDVLRGKFEKSPGKSY
jgi:hypothetical protein